MTLYKDRDRSLDFARGTFLVFMIVFHVFINFTYDWKEYSGIVNLLRPTTFAFAFLSGLTLIKFCKNKPYSYFVKKSLKLIVLFLALNLIRGIFEPSILNYQTFLQAFTIGVQDNFSFEILLALGIITFLFPLIKRWPLIFIIALSLLILIFNFVIHLPSYNPDIFLAFCMGVFVGKNLKTYKISRNLNISTLILIFGFSLVVAFFPDQSFISILLGSLYAFTLVVNAHRFGRQESLVLISYVSLFIYIAHIMLIKFINVGAPSLKSQNLGFLALVCIAMYLICRTIARLLKVLLSDSGFKKIYSKIF